MDALSQEDLSRDVWMLSQGPARDGSDPGLRGLAGIEQRLGQMKTLPAFGDNMRVTGASGWAVCGQKDGRSGDAVLIGAIDPGRGAGAADAPVAAVISLAKAWDLNAPPAHTLLFCAWSQQGGLEQLRASSPVPWDRLRLVVTFGPMGDKGPLQLNDGTLDGRPHLHVSTGERPEHGGPEDRMEALHFAVMAEQLREVHSRVEQVLSQK